MYWNRNVKIFIQILTDVDDKITNMHACIHNKYRNLFLKRHKTAEINISNIYYVLNFSLIWKFNQAFLNTFYNQEVFRCNYVFTRISNFLHIEQHNNKKNCAKKGNFCRSQFHFADSANNTQAHELCIKAVKLSYLHIKLKLAVNSFM